MFYIIPVETEIWSTVSGMLQGGGVGRFISHSQPFSCCKLWKSEKDLNNIEADGQTAIGGLNASLRKD